MFCSECGQRNSDDAKFCMSCGNSLVTGKTASSPSVEPEKSSEKVSENPDHAVPSSGDPVRYAQTELKDSGTVTVMSVIGFVFGLIGMLGSFIPCLGSFAFFIGIPAAIISVIGLFIAYSRNAKKTFAIVAVTISLIGVVISGWQYYAVISTLNETENALKSWDKALKKNLYHEQQSKGEMPQTTQERETKFTGQEDRTQLIFNLHIDLWKMHANLHKIRRAAALSQSHEDISAYSEQQIILMDDYFARLKKTFGDCFSEGEKKNYQDEILHTYSEYNKAAVQVIRLAPMHTGNAYLSSAEDKINELDKLLVQLSKH